MDNNGIIKQMPMSVEAEQALLGSLIISPDSFDKVADISADDFYLNEHKHIYSALIKMFSQNRIIDTVESNARFNGVMASLSDMAVHVLLENSGLSPEVAETVDSIKNTLNDVLTVNKDDYATEEEYKEVVSEKIGGVLEEYSIPLEKEQLDVVTDFVCAELEGKEEITDTDLAEFMAKYYEVYTSGELPEDFPVELPDELPDEIPEDVLDGIIGGGSDEEQEIQ